MARLKAMEAVEKLKAGAVMIYDEATFLTFPSFTIEHCTVDARTASKLINSGKLVSSKGRSWWATEYRWKPSKGE